MIPDNIALEDIALIRSLTDIDQSLYDHARNRTAPTGSS